MSQSDKHDAKAVLQRIAHVLNTAQVRWEGDTVLDYISALVTAGISHSAASSTRALEGLPNLRAIIDGRVSGHYTEWPMVRAELRELVMQWERALGELNHALHAELLDTGLVTTEQWNEAIAPKLKACGQAIRMQDRIGQRSAPVSATPRSEELAWLEQHGGSVGKVRDAGLTSGFCAGDGKGNAGYGDTPEAAIRVLMNRADDGGA